MLSVYPAGVKKTTPHQDSTAQMATAIARHMGAQALEFSRQQRDVAEGDMIAVWAAIVVHLEATS